MTIAMSDGSTYENSLDMLFAKDMPSREETQGPMPAVDMPKRLSEPNTYTPNEEDQLSNPIAPEYKDQNDPFMWGMGTSMDRKGPAHVPLPEPKFHEIMDHMDYLINPEKIQATPDNKDTTKIPPDHLSTGEYDQLNRDQKFQSDLNPFPSHEELQGMKRDFFDRMNDAWANRYPPEITPNEFGWYDDWYKHQKSLSIPELLDKHLQYKEVGPSSKDFETEREQKEQELFGLSPKQLRERGVTPGKRSEDDSIPPNARQTAAETKEPSPYGETYDKFVEHLEAASKFLNPSFIPSAEEFRDAPWKEKLGFMIGTSMMMMRPTPGSKPPSMEGTPLEFWKGNANLLDQQALEHYRKLDTPVARDEYANMIKKKIDSASEGGETSTSNITTPEIRGMKEGSDWSEVITKPDGTKETVYDQAKIERLRNLLDNGLTFKEIGEKMDVSRNSVNSMVRRLKTMDAEEVTPSEKKPNSPWSATEDKILKTWYTDPDSDLVEHPALLKHRSEGAINARIKTLGLEKTAEEEVAKPFVPKGAVRAPEKGSGSGGPYKETTMTGKSGISAMEEPDRKTANSNKVNPGQIDQPGLDEFMDKAWKNLGTSQEKDIPLVSPVTMKRLKEINPSAAKKLQQFELEMDYKHKSEDRQWLSDLSDTDVARYRKLYEEAQKEPPRDVKDIKYRIRRMLNPPPEK